MSEWISVKEKLPEEDQGVILCTRETETYGKHREKRKSIKISTLVTSMDTNGLQAIVMAASTFSG